jgi:hypothetical protein
MHDFCRAQVTGKANKVFAYELAKCLAGTNLGNRAVGSLAAVRFRRLLATVRFHTVFPVDRAREEELDGVSAREKWSRDGDSMSAKMFSDPAFDPTVKVLLQIVYEDVLVDLRRDYAIATEHELRSEVALAIYTLAKGGQTNSEQLRRYALACGLKQAIKSRQQRDQHIE